MSNAPARRRSRRNIVRSGVTIAALFLFPYLVSAGNVVNNSTTDGVGGLLDSIADVVSLIVPVLVGAGVAVFFWGLVKFVSHAGDEKTLEDGKQLMIWGMIGIFVMVALWSLVGYIQTELGLDTADTPENFPSLPSNLPS